MSISRIRYAARSLKSAGGFEFEQLLDDGVQAQSIGKWLFEASWEVANKVGGIYTVIRSKVPITKKEYGNNYVCLGPYNEYFVKMEVDEGPFDNTYLQETVESMRRRGIRVITGNWLIEGYPKVILFDIGSAMFNLGTWKTDLWNISHIGIPHGDFECNDILVFGFLVAWVLGEFLHQTCQIQRYVLANFHEWQAGIPVILCRARKLDISLLFTTHATLLGRYLCAGEQDFYNNLNKFEVDKEAGNRQIYHRYCIERAAVHCAHVFTTVSKITGFEAEYLLKRKPNMLTPNGLTVKSYEALHEFQNLHAINKEKINEFVRGHFHSHFDFDLDKTLYMFSAGRYEFSNKGVDMFIEALARLNYLLKKDNKGVTVIAFLIFPTRTDNFNVDSLRAQSIAKVMRDTVSSIQTRIGKRLYDFCLRGVVPKAGDMLTAEETIELKKCILAANRSTLPPICSHNVVDDAIDPILNALRRCFLFNSSSDRVKVIFHPEFLKSTSPLMPMDYEEFVRGCHIGVFPSYYEPWGYTPAECTVMGVPSVTTNLSGFGSFMEEHIADSEAYGIYVVDRRFKNPEESVQQLTRILHDFCLLTRRQRILLRNRTERLSELLDWSTLGIYYYRARQMALNMTHPEVEEEELRAGLRAMSVHGSAPSSRSSTPAPLDIDDSSSSEDGDDHTTIEAPFGGLRQESIKSLDPLALADVKANLSKHIESTKILEEEN